MCNIRKQIKVQTLLERKSSLDLNPELHILTEKFLMLLELKLGGWMMGIKEDKVGCLIILNGLKQQ